VTGRDQDAVDSHLGRDLLVVIGVPYQQGAASRPRNGRGQFQSTIKLAGREDIRDAGNGRKEPGQSMRFDNCFERTMRVGRKQVLPDPRFTHLLQHRDNARA
jgi:hypothetical protein